MKTYYVQYNVGNAKYVANYHDGEKTHSDGSPFYDIHISKNRRDHSRFINQLEGEGYTYKTTTP